jgi:glycine oxidase
MSGVSGMRVVVAGAGAVGSAVALALDRGGARVVLADPSPPGLSASGVAAGMLAPGLETVLDGGEAHFDLLSAARSRWDGFAASLGMTLDPQGALAVGAAADLDAWESRLAALGAACRRLGRSAAETMLAGLSATHGGLLVASDSRIDPRSALARMAAASPAVARPGLAVTDFTLGRVVFADGSSVAADALVIATGPSASLAALAPRLRTLTPVKGQILRAPAVTLSGPVIRLRRGYICPDVGGAVIGASMEAGRGDLEVDPAVTTLLLEHASAALPALCGERVTAEVGVRAATPDGLPWVGAAGDPGVWLAVGMRRNGWLLSPLVAEMIVAQMGGAEPPYDSRLGPGRVRD